MNKDKPALLQGTLDMLILKALATTHPHATSTSSLEKGSSAMRRIRSFILLLAGLGFSFTVGAEEPQPSRFKDRWVYPHPGFDLRNNEGTQQFIELIERSKKAGYNGVCVVTHAPYVTPPPDAYFQNMERVRAAAEKVDIELIPTVMKMNGYSNGILSNNPNLAPGVPVKDCVFVVRDGKATVAEGGNLLSGGDFESFTGADRPDGWDWLDLPGKVSFEDREVMHGGKFPRI